MHTNYRIDNYPIKQGAKPALLVKSPSSDTEINIKAWSYEPSTDKVIPLYFKEDKTLDNGTVEYLAKPLWINGFIFIVVNNQPIIKKVGHYSGLFIIGYKPNYNLKCKINNVQHNMRNIISSFYCINVKAKDLVEVLNVQYLIPNLYVEKIKAMLSLTKIKNKFLLAIKRKHIIMSIKKRKLSLTLTQGDEQ